MQMRQLLLLAGAFCSLLSCHGNNSLSSKLSGLSQPQDHFLGSWQLNREKSDHTHYFEPPTFTIERQGDKDKFTFGSRDDKGIDHRWWFETDMKGTWIQISGLNIPEPPHIRVIRKDSDSYETSSDLFSVFEHCRVSEDGQTMSVRRQLFVDNEPSEHVFIFDRVKQR
jgi:hypothetical protein